jgi:hypothetical protein
MVMSSVVIVAISDNKLGLEAAIKYSWQSPQPMRPLAP